MKSPEDWGKALEAAHKHEEAYRSRAETVLKRYRDEGDTGKTTEKPPKMNLLWSNTEAQRPALYSSSPKPVVTNRFTNPDQMETALVREATDIMERAVSFSIDNGLDDFDKFAGMVVNDFLLPGRSVDRVIYEPLTEDNALLYEQVRYHHVPWKHFRYDPQDRWEDVNWVAFGDHFYTKAEIKDRFGLSRKKMAALNFTKFASGEEMVQVWEIWYKTDKRVLWYVEGYEEFLDDTPPPVDLVGFYDMPPPVYAIRDNDSLIPIPEYTMYQYQAKEIDRLTERIAKITNAIRANFMYAGQDKIALSQLLSADDNTGVPVAEWAAVIEKGGIDGMIAWSPVEQYVKVLQILVAQRSQLIQQVYELTGISDLFRGTTDPRETARAQQLKANFGARRIMPKQQAIQAHFRDLFRIAAETMVETFSRETLQDMVGKPIIDPVMQLLRSDADRLFRIDVETDSTIAPDEQAQKQELVEFMGAMGNFLQVGMGIAQVGPAGFTAMVAMLQWMTRSFRAPREVQQALEQLGQNPPQPPQGPSPEQQMQEREQQRKEANTASEIEARMAQMMRV